MMVPFQTQVNNFWKKQTNTQRIMLVVLLVAAAVLIPVLITWATSTSYSVAYSGLSETDAGAIIAKLDENGIPYQLKGTGTIMVPSDQVYEARIKMAVEGLPESSTVGYELFSGNTLGMTEFTQQVNYQRALEGELERTIGSLDAIEAVRVHVVTPEKSLLTSDQSPATASVTVKERSGQSLDAAQVSAITHLVASAVENLQPENVVVVDTNGELLAGGAASDTQSLASQSDSQRSAELAAAADVRQRVQSMLDSILGPNKAIVQASVSMDWTQRQITSNTYDPTPQAVRSSQIINEYYSGDAATTSGVPGAATNLPTAAPNAVATAVVGANGYTHTEETYNYEVSQVQAVEVVNPGTIDRVSISVMVDNITDAAQIQTIKNAVTAAAGINEARGDQVVVESIAFDRTYYDQQTTDLEQSAQTNQYIQIGLAVLAALVVLGLILYFGRMISNLRTSSAEAWQPVMLPVGEMAMDTGLAGALPAQLGPDLAAMSLPEGMPSTGMPQMPSTAQRTTEDVMVELSARHQQQTQNTAEDTQRIKMINKLAEDNPATVAEIIQIWLNEDNKKNG
jgi:flagellar M-ring protein FliF